MSGEQFYIKERPVGAGDKRYVRRLITQIGGE